ncbi:MAG: DNA translocase FtsK 4TM domain-containing protein, partial [Oscillospiraceae bacterium]|nr:DNA translocase FtsK 4TM domain-containing protein [Oscillospiraceae bacterium]
MAENKNKKKKNSSKSEPEKKPEETKPEKPEISMPAVPEPESESKTEQEEPEKKGFSVQVYSVCLFASSVLTALLIFVQGSAMWKVLHEALKGFFGIPVIAVPVGLFLFARRVDEEKQKENLKNQLKWMGISLVFVSCFIEIMFGKGRVLNYNFAQCFKMFYEDGIAWRGGGMLSALAYPVLYLFGDVGSKILICLLLFVSIMLLSKKSLTELFEMIKKFFQNIFGAIRQDRKDEKILEQYAQEQLENELHDEQEALEIAEQGAIKNLSVIQENLFSIDIPIENE